MGSIFEELGYITEAIKKKLMLIFAVILAGFFVSFQLLDPVLEKMKQDLLPEGATLIYISPVEVIMLKLKISIVIGIILAAPLICYYVYKTLKVRFGIKNPLKKSYLSILLGSAVSLFILGVCYSYFFMLPLVLTYLNYISTSAGVVATYSIYDFVSFVIIITLILGVAFEVPIFIVFAVHTGLVPIATLKEYRRYIYVAMFVLAAFFTPPDVVSQLVVAFPLVIFYEIGIIVASFIDRRRSVSLQAS
ncbi:MAG: twin-arginine translocase subunit TatC [Candidatus Methanospirareceae archaeon]